MNVKVGDYKMIIGNAILMGTVAILFLERLFQ